MSHFECLIINWVQCLLLHWSFLLTVTGLVRQEIGFNISVKQVYTHTHTQFVIFCIIDTVAAVCTFTRIRCHLRVRAVLACWSDVLAAIHFDLQLLLLGVINQWELNTAPHLHYSEIARAEQTHHASTELRDTRAVQRSAPTSLSGAESSCVAGWPINEMDVHRHMCVRAYRVAQMKAAVGTARFQRGWIWLCQAAAQGVSVPIVALKVILNTHTHKCHV